MLDIYLLPSEPLLCGGLREKYFHELHHLNLRTALHNDRHYLHFTDGKTEAQAQILYLSKGA